MRIDPQKVKEEHGKALVMNIVIVPWVRALDSPLWGRFAAFLSIIPQILYGDLFVAPFALAVFVGLADWWFGRLAAQKEHGEDFDSRVALWGLHSKFASWAILLAMHQMEHVAWHHGYDFHHLPSMAMAVALFTEEIKSLHRNKLKLGGRPIPFVGIAIEILERTSHRLMGGDQKLPPSRRRRTGDHEITVEMPAMDVSSGHRQDPMKVDGDVRIRGDVRVDGDVEVNRGDS